MSCSFSYFSIPFSTFRGTSATSNTITSSGEEQEYLLYVPKSYDGAEPAPLVITLHTSMSWDSAAMAVRQWNQVADEHRFIVVYPEGTGFGPKSWDMTGSESPVRMPDVVSISKLIDKLEASYNIDRTRIYANGMSNGGGMAFVLSCTLPDRIAAAGLVSPGLDPGWGWCPDHKLCQRLLFTGPPIRFVSTTAAIQSSPAAHFRAFRALWRIGLDETSVGRTRSALRLAADVTRTQYRNCADKADVVLYTIKGEGHQWPGGKRVAAEWMLGRYSHSIDATRQMWAFFDEHPLTRK